MQGPLIAIPAGLLARTCLEEIERATERRAREELLTITLPKPDYTWTDDGDDTPPAAFAAK